MPAPLPREYVAFAVGRARVVARRDWADAVRGALDAAPAGAATLHGWAACQEGRGALVGRGMAYAVALPGRAERVVVRHNRHGGTLARFTGDRFLPPTRAAHELTVAHRLTTLGVPTPTIVAYVTYPAGPLFRTVDVASLEIAPSRDLSHVLTQDGPTERALALEATAGLVATLARAGARHHDLNVKNVLLTFTGGAAHAHVLDLDRVELGAGAPRAVLDRNLARLVRSARKWRQRWGATVSEGELTMLVERARGFLGG